jgi:hypothetical protein
MTTLRISVDGIGVWAPHLRDFDALRSQLAGKPSAAAVTRPPAETLSPNERRRAPDSVLIATEVAGQAVAMSGRAAHTMACVFASAYGDQAITDYMCATLARAPDELSPTRFHNSVQNAPVGYWTIATTCRQSSSAVCAGGASFGAGLLEAATLVCADNCSVLLVCSDTVGQGPVGDLTGSRRAFASALVLSPETDASSMGQLALTLGSSTAIPSTHVVEYDDWITDNPSAAALPLLAMLAGHRRGCILPASEQLSLSITVKNIRR